MSWSSRMSVNDRRKRAESDVQTDCRTRVRVAISVIPNGRFIHVRQHMWRPTTGNAAFQEEISRAAAEPRALRAVGLSALPAFMRVQALEHLTDDAILKRPAYLGVGCKEYRLAIASVLDPKGPEASVGPPSLRDSALHAYLKKELDTSVVTVLGADSKQAVQHNPMMEEPKNRRFPTLAILAMHARLEAVFSDNIAAGEAVLRPAADVDSGTARRELRAKLHQHQNFVTMFDRAALSDTTTDSPEFPVYAGVNRAC